VKILLPTDGSECADKTLEWASRMFDKERTQYYLLHVIPPTPELSMTGFESEDAVQLLKAARKLLEKNGCRVVATEYLFGDEVNMICAYAENMDMDQVVIGSHGRKGLAKFLLGSVGVAVLENCKRSVIVYRDVEFVKPSSGSGKPVLATIPVSEASA
jgi:nucleotide-binding universal stress UspA family protein